MKLGLSTEQVRILAHLRSDRGIMELMSIIGRRNRTKFREQILDPMMGLGLVEMTVPDKPRSSKQKYRLTSKGKKVMEGVRE